MHSWNCDGEIAVQKVEKQDILTVNMGGGGLQSRCRSGILTGHVIDIEYGFGMGSR